MGLFSLFSLIGLFFLERAALSKLEALGVEYGQMDRGLFTRQFHNVHFRGMRADRVTGHLLSPKKVKIAGLRVSVDPEAGVGQLGAEGPAQIPEDIEADLTQVSFFWGSNLMVEGLSGQLSEGRLVLNGPDLHLSSGADLLQVDWDGTISIEALTGDASLHIERGGRLSIEVDIPEIQIEHPLLATKALVFQQGLVRLEGDRLGKSLQGSLSVDGVECDLRIERDKRKLNADLVLPPSPLAELLVPLRPVIPELKKAEIEGSVSAQAQLQWPAMTWGGDFHMESIKVRGAVPQLQALRRGPLQHRILDEEGDPVLRETGEGSADWTVLRNIASPMRHAVIAAEDIRFTEHAGYDMEAIREALHANQEAGKVLRGGSSLSQQLAKNLFLDGQRTLVRKIRELLIAVELDQFLGKGRILELYLNLVEWGPGIYGIGAASERYFMRRPSQLQPHEAAFLAAILPSPRRFYREQYLKDKARETRIDWILENMGNAGQLSAAQVKKWSTTPLRFVPPPTE